MDDSTIDALRRAYEVTPENGALLGVLLDALAGAGRLDDARALLEGVPPSRFPSADERRVAARILIDAGAARQALAFLTDEAPESWILRARAHAALGELEEGRAEYRRTIEANRTLEDPELLRLLSSRVRDVEGASGNEPIRLKVISGGQDPGIDQWLIPENERITFADVGGLDAVKQLIEKRIILPFHKPNLFQRFKKRVGGGILLYGAPGCGKTLLARATAGQANAKFYNVAISDVLDMWFGESEHKLSALFEEARRNAPSVLFFDEIEALGGKRQYNRDSTASKLVSQFLSEMDGFAKSNNGVLVIGATNVPWAIDPAFRRPGRFDRVLFVPPPDKQARRAILEIHLRDRPSAGIEVERVAKHTSGFSGADLANLIETATDFAIEASLAKGTEVPLSAAHVDRALAEVKATTTEWLTTARNYARYANEGGQYDEVLEFLEKHGKSR